MKKILSFVLLAIILLQTSCVSEAYKYDGGIVLRGDIPSPANLAYCYANEDIVYVTKSGKKYHKENCPYLKSSKIMISLGQAIMEGKEPCSKCFSENNEE